MSITCQFNKNTEMKQIIDRSQTNKKDLLCWKIFRITKLFHLFLWHWVPCTGSHLQTPQMQRWWMIVDGWLSPHSCCWCSCSWPLMTWPSSWHDKYSWHVHDPVEMLSSPAPTSNWARAAQCLVQLNDWLVGSYRDGMKIKFLNFVKKYQKSFFLS